MNPVKLLCGGLIALAGVPALADTVYRCVNARGAVSYSDAPCGGALASGEQNRVLTFDNPAPGMRGPAVVAVPAVAPIRAPVRAARDPLFLLFYNPKDAPVERPIPQMVAVIREAAERWSKGCKVTIRYGGETDDDGPGSEERVVVRWRPEYFTTDHPAIAGMRLGGTGSLQGGISLLPRMTDERLLKVVAHELGHVLGIRHRHLDRTSIMSYLADPMPTEPSAGDYIACNMAMKRRFGIAYDPPPNSEPDPGVGLTDHVAAELRIAPNELLQADSVR